MGLVLLALLGFGALFSEVRCDPMEVCQPRNSTYKIGDSKQCDKYFECAKNSKGHSLERLCPDGFMFSLEIHDCDYPHNVPCEERPALQPTQSTNPQCPRSNGFYAYPPSDSCQKFHHCLEGVAYEKTCPEGVIFDPSKGACIHPDLSKRPECAAKEVLNFTCPNSLQRFSKLKFGDHDRHAHPEDCRKFLICLKNGKPRVGGCPNGKVFNNESGYCDSPKNVPDCKNYYGKKDPETLAKESESDTFNFGGQDSYSTEQQETKQDKDSEVEENEIKNHQQSSGGKKPSSKPAFHKVSKRHAGPGHLDEPVAPVIVAAVFGPKKDEKEEDKVATKGNKDAEVKGSKGQKARHAEDETDDDTDTDQDQQRD